ncbi:MAG: hypothetical protein QOF01_572 [Thermomicrobiales bacterium]|nr:hypothetical protein [Thermomicrobiales bacterium]
MNDTPDADLPARLRHLRKTLGLTQTELARRLGVSNVTVNRWEHGRTVPGPAARARLQRLKETPSSGDALCGTGSPTPPPLPATALVGRREEVAAIGAALTAARLVTLVGPGGAGKTRLALEVARIIAAHFPDGVRWVALADLADPLLVPEAVARALGLPTADIPATERVVASCRSRRLLLLLDNCEHLTAASAELAAAVLISCPGVRLLATSRAPLEVPGEQVCQVAPLDLPDPLRASDPAAVLASAAGRLFVERTRARHPAFALTARNAPAVAEVCRRLDGLPLALELAAARIPLLSPAEIATRLDDRFRLLRTRATVVAPRHRALDAALDWSHDLLDAPDRAIFAQLSIFAGGFDLAAIESIASGVDAGDVIAALGRLVAQSLVETVDGGGAAPTRYRLLETVRAYAAEQLAARGEADAAGGRHATYYARLAETAAPALDGPDQVAWFDRLDADRDNLRATLAWFDAQGETEAYLRLAGALWRFWWVRGALDEGRRWLTAGLLAGDAVAPSVRARALTAAGILAREQADFCTARSLLAAGLAAWREVNDPEGLSFGLVSAALAALDAGDHDAAQLGYTEALALARARDDRQQIALRTFNLAVVALARDDPHRADTLLAESLPALRALDHRFGIAIATFATGVVAARLGANTTAESCYAEALTRFRELGYPDGIALALDGLGHCHRVRGEFPAAASSFAQALDLWGMRGLNHRVAHGLQSVVLLSIDRGHWRDAARLAAAARSVAAGSRPCYFPLPSAAYETSLERVRAVLGDTAFAAAWQAGTTLSAAEAIASWPRLEASIPTAPRSRNVLTPRGTEVLRLAAAGRTNAEIATVLGIGIRTVEQHLTAAYAALGARGRADAVARALAAGLQLGGASSTPRNSGSSSR